jgi:hypothetical protein
MGLMSKKVYCIVLGQLPASCVPVPDPLDVILLLEFPEKRQAGDNDNNDNDRR